MPDPQQLETIEQLLENGDQEAALTTYRNLMEDAGQDYGLWVNYGSFLCRCAQYEEAIAVLQKSVEIQESAEAFHNLGVCYEKTGKLEDAVSAYREAIRVNPDFVQSHNDLAALYENSNQLEKAIDHYQIATTLSPKTPSYWSNLANARQTLGRYHEAFSAIRFAFAAGEDAKHVAHLYAGLFRTSQDFEMTDQVGQAIAICMDEPSVNDFDVQMIHQKWFLHQTLYQGSNVKRSQDFLQAIEKGTLNWEKLNQSQFISMLSTLPTRDIDFERCLTALRAHCLEHLSQDNSGASLWNNALLFLNGLACQCFLNEYIFNETEQEKSAVEALEKRVVEGQGLSLYDIAIYACYRPLHALPRAADLLKALEEQEVMKSLLNMQIAEPLQEAEIKKEISTLTSIDDDVSKLVKEQYEANPYPRWVNLPISKTMPFKDALQQIIPHLEDELFAHIDQENTKTLIAGCGTGKQSINTANVFGNSDILAIDLSATSLAYAIRKTREYGYDNIEYGIGDLLKVDELGEQFDVIQCGGVLHHMSDPMAGWRALYDILKPGGFMLIALYSDIARQSVVAAREFIAKNGFSPDLEGIRACRQAIQDLPEDDPVRGVMNWRDFFVVSDTRDLIFHVQEHRYTALQLREDIASLGMEFLGFHLKKPWLEQKYQAQFPDDPKGLDLENWHKFEKQFPKTFDGMYQFWLQKPV